MKEKSESEKLREKGKAAYEKGNFQVAARSFEAAQQAYLIDMDELNAAEMANNASVAYLLDEKAELALKVVTGTADIFRRAGDLKREGMALGNLAAALETLDRKDEAVEAYQQSAEILEKAHEDQLRAKVLQSLSVLQFRRGKQLQALATMQDGLEGIRRPNPKQTFLKKLLRVPFEMSTQKKMR